MALTTWRQDQLWALAIATALSLGAGFAGGYFTRAGNDVAATSTSAVTLTTACGAQSCPEARVKSYERLLEEADRLDLPDEPASADTDFAAEQARVLREERPMDGLHPLPPGTRLPARLE